MKPPYHPAKLDDALKNICPGQAPPYEYAEILNKPTLTADFLEQRLASKKDWYNRNPRVCERHEDEHWQDMVLRVVYKGNLGIEVPRDGHVVNREESGDHVSYDPKSLLIIDWRSWCPVLIYCAHTGQPMIPVCSVLYHMQFQYLLSLVLPGALFTRDYSRIRPDSCCCREIIFYEDGKRQGPS